MWIESVEEITPEQMKLGSLPSRGVWIERTIFALLEEKGYGSLPSRGVWIESGIMQEWYNKLERRSPHGECGLKANREP